MIDLTTLTEPELADLLDAVSRELSRRSALERAPEQIDRALRVAAEAEGVTEGGQWVETTLGYPEGVTVIYPLPDGTGEGTWVNRRRGNVYAPGSEGGGWELLPPDENTPPLWVKPAWAEVGYSIGDLVTYPTYADGQVFRSLLDKNTWSPTDYPDAWELVSAEPEPEPDPEAIPVWVKPQWNAEEGGAYALGDQVHYPDADGPVYESTHDGWNTWPPAGEGAYGWVEVA